MKKGVPFWDVPEFYNYIGNCYYFQKQYDRAIEEYREAVYLNRDNKEFNFNLGRAFVDTKSYENGIYWLNIGKEDAYAYYYLGKAYTGVRNFKKAEEAFEKSIRFCDNNGFKKEIQEALEEERKLKNKQ